MDGDRGGQTIAPGAGEDEQEIGTTSVVQENTEAGGAGVVEDKPREKWLERKQENEQKENHQPAAGIQSDREQQEEAPSENRKNFGEHGGFMQRKIRQVNRLAGSHIIRQVFWLGEF